ncbi:MAG TPA: hypothetical protein PKW30_05910 [Campylobacterales bacterium]|nr:hypothetical protein [Campylobacterales bacterium]
MRRNKYFTHAGILASVSTAKLNATASSCAIFTKSNFSKTSTGLAPPSQTSI